VWITEPVSLPGSGRSENGMAPRMVLLPRKEVIQPHLPVRLPCYDFVPVATPALGRCLPEGLAHGLQALATPMT
jgi:hypothetical protein